jgi:D-beta-D-heptose 7-phosphate kinase/D-beta-D-heptose 1-phosphate adenosyltransferase
MDSRGKAILKTLLYADIFNYPLTQKEIFRFLIAEEKIEENLVRATLKKLKSLIGFSKNYYFILGKKKLVQKRLEKEKISAVKLKKAKKIIDSLSFIPSVKFIGISGGLSMKNTNKEDDIDIFVITEKNLLWTTRFLLVVLLIFLGVYRKRNSKDTKDKICLNMIVTEDSIYFEKANQNLYVAHEIMQLIPVFDRDSVYKNFIFLNSWVNKFLPNAYPAGLSFVKKRKNILGRIFNFILKALFFEKILEFIQLKYMKNHITKEKISEKFLAFHPFDYQTYILSSYRKRLNDFGLKT